MEALTEIKSKYSIGWKDTQGTKFFDTSYVEWFETNTIRVSDSAYADTHYWSDHIISFTPPQYSLANTFGGYCALSFGDMEFDLDLFTVSTVVNGTTSDLWPIPREMYLTQRFTETDEASLVLMYNGTIYLASYDRESVRYDLYPETYEQDLLSEKVDYNGDTVAVQRAFGEVTHITPLRLPDLDIGAPYGEAPTYHKASITGTLAIQITGAADNGSGKVRFTTATAHGFSTGNTVYVEVNDFSSTYNTPTGATATVIDTTHFDFDSIAYVDDQEGHAYKSGYWRVYDDGVPIPGNVYENGDESFSLTATPTGEVTVSGTGACSTLSEIFEWAKSIDNLQLSYSYDSSIEENPSPTVKYLANTQQKMIDFLSQVSAFFGHMFYINNDVLKLVDMTKNNGTRTLTEYDYFALPSYEYNPPKSILKSKWVKRSRVEETIGKYIKAEDFDVEVTTEYPYGEEFSITPFHDQLSEIRNRLIAINTYMHKARIRVKIPVSDNLPVPGEQIIFTDTSFKANIITTMNCRTIRYDFENDTVEIEGDGEITAP